jgi:hypothetical protein
MTGAQEALVQAATSIGIGMTFQELDPCFMTMQNAFRTAAASVGAAVVVTDAHHDVSKQISDVEDMLQQNIDILPGQPDGLDRYRIGDQLGACQGRRLGRSGCERRRTRDIVREVKELRRGP